VAPPEDLDECAELAIEVWGFMGGWAPERLALAVEWFNVRDPDRLVSDLMLMRGEMGKPLK